VQFWVYFTYMVIAGAVADWYFRTNAQGQRIIEDRPVCNSLTMVCRFYLGSIAFGALIIAIIQFIRAVVKYVEKKAGGDKEPNKLKKCLFCLLQCCLKCCQDCVEGVSENAYVWIMVYGGNFCSGICSAIGFLIKNLGRVAAVSVVGKLLMLLGKIMVVLLTTGITAFLFINIEYYKDNLNSIIVPTALACLIAYGTATVFMMVFEAAVDSIFMCFLIDEKFNGAAVHASEQFRRLIDSDAVKKRWKEMKEINENIENNKKKNLTVVDVVG